MNISLFKTLPALIVLSILTSCTPRHYFKVDAISGGEIQTSGSVFLVSGSADMKDSDLRFKEAANFVQTALEGKGFHVVEDIKSADTLVEISFGVADPREITEVRSYPQTYWHPGFSYAIRIPIYDKGGFVIDYQTRIVREPSRSYTHWEDRVETGTVFEKFLKIEAYDNRLGAPSQEPLQLWSVVVSNSDYSDDIRDYLPYMVAAAIPYIGQDTGSQVFVSMQDDDPIAQFIRAPDVNPPPSERN